MPRSLEVTLQCPKGSVPVSGLRHEQRISHPHSSPFSSGTWKVHFYKVNHVYSVTEISWHSVYPAVLSKLKTLTVKTGTVTTKADGSKSWDRIDIVKDFTVGKFTLPYEITQPTSDPVIGFEWTLESDGNGYEAVKHPGNMLSPPHYNDVRFDFPYEGRELWCNSATLSRASPYYKTLFASEFSEGVDVIRYDDLSESDDVSSCASLPFDDSDDDERAEPTTTPLARSCATPHRTIKITETAFSTYHAVLFWIMSDVIEFAPLRSTLSAADRRRNPTPSDPTIPIPASPKSVYRLSHLLELPELQAMALSGLRAQITVTNVLDELFCETSGCYDAILEVLIAFVKENKSDMRNQEHNLLEIAHRSWEVAWMGKVACRTLAATL